MTPEEIKKMIARANEESAKYKVKPKSSKEQFPKYISPIEKKINEINAKWTKFDGDVYDIADELAELLVSKHNDYGPKNIAQAPGGALNGLRVRIHDKIARINNLIDSGKTPNNESLEDSFKDLANYAIISLMVLREKWPQE